MRIIFETAGRKVTLECEAETDCKQLRKLLESDLGKSLSNMSLYDKESNQKLEDSDTAPREVFGVKSKNESAC